MLYTTRPLSCVSCMISFSSRFDDLISHLKNIIGLIQQLQDGFREILDMFIIWNFRLTCPTAKLTKGRGPKQGRWRWTTKLGHEKNTMVRNGEHYVRIPCVQSSLKIVEQMVFVKDVTQNTDVANLLQIWIIQLILLLSTRSLCTTMVSLLLVKVYRKCQHI
jgi:hypothetical protein